MTPAELLAKWSAEADAMRRRGVMVNGAGLLAEVLEDFRAVQHDQLQGVLTLEEASVQSGYGVEHLGRLVREGRIPNAGRKGSPRIRVADLPRKPAALARTALRAYDPGADARTLLDRQRGGNNA